MKCFLIFLIFVGFIGFAFAEIMPSGSAIAINTPYNSYVSGDRVFAGVNANPISNVTISLIDPSKNIVHHVVETTDEKGSIHTSFTLPFYAEYGTWMLNATSGSVFDTVSFDVVALQRERMINDIVELETYRPIGDPFSNSDHVLVGTIMQVENATENMLRYSIDVDFYLKNKQSFDFITVLSDKVQEPSSDIPAINAILSLNSPSFVEGDTAFVYLKNIDGQQKILPQSFVIEKDGWYLISGIVHTSPIEKDYERGDDVLFSGMVQKSELYQSARKDKPFDIELTVYDKQGLVVISKSLGVDANATYQYELQTADLPVGEYEYEIDFSGGRSGNLWTSDIAINPTTDYASPLKQFKAGITFNEIQCKENLTLVQKYDGTPACVTPETKEKLIEREGWYRVFPCHGGCSGGGQADPTKYKIPDEVDIKLEP